MILPKAQILPAFAICSKLHNIIMKIQKLKHEIIPISKLYFNSSPPQLIFINNVSSAAYQLHDIRCKHILGCDDHVMKPNRRRKVGSQPIRVSVEIRIPRNP